MDYSLIALIFVFAAVFGLGAKMLKQPLFVGYLIAGIFLSWSGITTDFASLESLGHIGVTLLLFLMGLEMSLNDITTVGKTAFITALTQMIVSFVGGFLFGMLWGLNPVSSFYIGIALSLSSTIVSVKLISEKNDLVSLYGRIAIGVLLVQDLVAIILLMFLAGGSIAIEPSESLITFIKGLVVIVLIWLTSKKVIPFIFEKFVGSNDFLFVFSVAYALGVSSFIQKFTGFSLEVGGFLAGVSLSSLPEHLQIATKARPLRDFFLTIFFLTLGTGIAFSGAFSKVLFPAIILSISAIVIHFFAVMVSVGILGFRKRVSFMVGLSISQISEFSIIIAAIGLSLGHINQFTSSLIALTGVITMIVSTYLITNSEAVYKNIKKYLKYFEKKNNKAHIYMPNEKLENHVVLVGCDRTGTQIANYLIKKKIDFVVVDFNPKVFIKLTAQNIPTVFGDINDEEIMESANVRFSTLVILTTSNLSDNLNFLSAIKDYEIRPNTIFTSVSKTDAIKLYEAGASYVVVPDIVAGEHIKHLIHTHGFKGQRLTDAGQSHFKRLIFI